MAIYDTINDAKRVHSELCALKERFDELTAPRLSDTDMLSDIYRSVVGRAGIDKRDERHYFVVIAVYLYSPVSLFGRFPIRAGLCRQMGQIVGRCRQEVSEIFSQARFRYENVPSFREQVEAIFEQMESHSQTISNK